LFSLRRSICGVETKVVDPAPEPAGVVVPAVAINGRSCCDSEAMECAAGDGAGAGAGAWAVVVDVSAPRGGGAAAFEVNPEMMGRPPGCDPVVGAPAPNDNGANASGAPNVMG
jgi:hypothetical protein